MPVTKEEYLEAVATLEEWVNGPDSDWNELKFPADIQMLGILKALRHILKCGEGESILYRAATIMRRHDQMYAALGHYGSKLQIESSEGRVVVKSEPHPDFLDFPGPQHG